MLELIRRLRAIPNSLKTLAEEKLNAFLFYLRAGLIRLLYRIIDRLGSPKLNDYSLGCHPVCIADRKGLMKEDTPVVHWDDRTGVKSVFQGRKLVREVSPEKTE